MTQSIQNNDRTQANINLIWKHTHSDFRSTMNGEKSVLYYDKGTTTGPIKSLPDDIFAEKLEYARKKELRAQRDELLLPLFKKFGVERFITETAFWRDSKKEVVQLIKYIASDETPTSVSLSEQQANTMLSMLETMEIPFPNSH